MVAPSISVVLFPYHQLQNHVQKVLTPNKLHKIVVRTILFSHPHNFKKAALSDNLFSFLLMLIFGCLPPVRLSMCGLTVEFFCCSPTCQPTNWLKCQIFKVSAHRDRHSISVLLLYEFASFMSIRANIFCFFTT